MEEILASIRRIIAEDGEGTAATGPPPRPAEAQPQPAPPPEDILELTESVAEDGTVVSLTPGRARKPPPAPESPRDSTAAPSLADAPLELAPAPEEEPEPAPEPPPLRLRSAATVARRVEPSIIEPPPAPAAPPAETPAEREPPTRLTRAAPEPERASEPEPPPMLGDQLVSSATAAASVAALSQLADLGQKGKVGTSPIGEAGRTLESLVRELLKPMLRDWLDANLAAMVERLVREEIQRMARNAQNR